MRRRFFNSRINNKIIIYTSLDNLIVMPYKYDFGATIIKNTINNNIGMITFDRSVTIIGDRAFYNCYRLASIQIPNSVTSIGAHAFDDCTSLTSIQIPNSVTSIGDCAFYGCSNLTSIEIPNSVTSIKGNTFEGCTSLTSIQIPNSVTSIDGGTFSGCTNLTSIQIPDSVTSIGNYAFRGCSSLTSIEIPNSVTRIYSYVFEGCSSLTSIQIGNSVTRIGEEVFNGCTGLKSVYVKATTPPTLGGGILGYNSSNPKIYVPRTSLNAYKTASGWRNYASDIEPYDFDGGGTLIAFTVGVNIYQAEEGMTWEQFVSSKYNNGDITITAPYVVYSQQAIALNGSMVESTDIIISNTRYGFIV